MKVKAVNDWILVEPVKEEVKDEVKASGIVIPKLVKENQKKKKPISIKAARVVQISSRVPWFAAKDETEIGYEVGDVIYYYGKTGISYEEDGVQYEFMKWDNIVAIGADKDEKSSQEYN